MLAVRSVRYGGSECVRIVREGSIVRLGFGFLGGRAVVRGGECGENINIIFLPVFLLLFAREKGFFCDRRHGLGRPPPVCRKTICATHFAPFVVYHPRIGFGFDYSHGFSKWLNILETKELFEQVIKNCEICGNCEFVLKCELHI